LINLFLEVDSFLKNNKKFSTNHTSLCFKRIIALIFFVFLFNYRLVISTIYLHKKIFLWSRIIKMSNNELCCMCKTHKVVNKDIPRSIRRGRKRPLLIVFDSFGSDRITAVFHTIVKERKRSDTPFAGSLRQLLTVYDTRKNGRSTITAKWAIYTPYNIQHDKQNSSFILTPVFTIMYQSR
jgi:hypothetical protein